MENAWSSSKMKLPKLRTLNENVPPPLQVDLDDKRGRYLQSTTMSPRLQPFAENIDVGSPIARYFFVGSPLSGKVVPAGEAFTPPTFGSSKYRTGKAYCGNSSGSSSFGSRSRLSPSPLSSIENLDIASLMSPPTYRTPVKGDDDVLVMDAILVRPMSGAKNGRSSSSSGRSSSSSSSASKSMFKTETCRAWEESGNCRYNSKCQFAHGKEELHPSRLSTKSKSGAQPCKSFIRAGSSMLGPSCSIVHQLCAATESDHLVTTSQPPSPEPNYTLANSITYNDWSPVDDGIEVVLPNGSGKVPSREEIDACISTIVYGTTGKRRLPAFVALCEG
ncbi:hypothetical protein RJT34_04113 [Clitoria ternatea]|uniref:C3H1-type domain-containing protein n=1 Tax=Clitoria ternatea TaxID=43366 RepID=A0AAN9KL08_CLITE